MRPAKPIPYRVVCFGTRYSKRGRVERFAWVAWNPDEETARLAGRPGFGSFDWLGLAAAKNAAGHALACEGADQVQIRTNQDRILVVFNRDYRRSHYTEDSERLIA